MQTPNISQCAYLLGLWESGYDNSTSYFVIWDLIPRFSQYEARSSASFLFACVPARWGTAVSFLSWIGIRNYTNVRVNMSCHYGTLQKCNYTLMVIPHRWINLPVWHRTNIYLQYKLWSNVPEPVLNSTLMTLELRFQV